MLNIGLKILLLRIHYLLVFVITVQSVMSILSVISVPSALSMYYEPWLVTPSNINSIFDNTTKRLATLALNDINQIRLCIIFC